MSRRASLVALLALGSVLAALSAAGAQPEAGSSLYVVRQDPRLCPSPRCGGYWVALANRDLTRCSDGALRMRCYVARAVDRERHPLAAVPDGSLARAEVEPWDGELGELVVERVFAPVGGRTPSGRYYRVVDLGIRCVRAPCFSLRATVLNRREQVTLSGIGLGAMPVDARGRVEAALGTKNGALARGRIVADADGGRVLRATRIYLP